MQIFNNSAFGQIRTVDCNGEPWFIAKDVCNSLDIKNSRDALTRLDEDENHTVTGMLLRYKKSLMIIRTG